MERFNPTRLDLARRRRGLTKTELAQRAQLSTGVLRAYERGEKEPTTSTVHRLAETLSFPVSFFTADDLDEPSIDGVSFRALSSMTARQQAQAQSSAALAVELGEWIHSRFDLPKSDVPRLGNDEPEAAAEAVRVAWGLGQRRAPNMVHLLEAHGVRVFSLLEDCAEVDAFSFWRRGVPYVFLNANKTPEHSRMDAAHELGHLVMHHKGGPGGRQAEDEAQLFGAAFLMPKRSVLAEAPRGGTVMQIIKAKRRWNVSAMNLAYRMHKLGLLSDWQARTAFIQLTRMGYRKGEPNGISRETSQVLQKVFDALRAEGVSRAAVARELHLPLDEVNRATFGLVASAQRSGETDASTEPSPPTHRPDLHVVAS
jgi:Zn-dependent peptidase ImmA (M78 family)/DNA-binding XRE family transcriptional regulator